LPLHGFGTWKVTKDDAPELIPKVIEAGVRHIDCALVYGNQEAIGKGIKNALDRKIVKREELVITSKLWNTNHRPENVKKDVAHTLRQLGLDYLDYYIMHFPVSLRYQDTDSPDWSDPQTGRPELDPVPIVDTWRAMEALVDEGKVKAIGVSNFGVALMHDLMASARIPISICQVELHPYLAQPRLVEWCQAQGIQMVAYSSFGPSSYDSSKHVPPLFEHETVVALAKQLKRSPAQILLRWATQRGIAVIPKSSSAERAKENLSLDFKLDDAAYAALDKLDQGLRFND
ncbi:hypothetical protein CXG81DRAFT_7886, partial [Caulochytrium protostelioides]